MTSIKGFTITINAILIRSKCGKFVFLCDIDIYRLKIPKTKYIHVLYNLKIVCIPVDKNI